jgi:hypothetical protein
MFNVRHFSYLERRRPRSSCRADRRSRAWCRRASPPTGMGRACKTPCCTCHSNESNPNLSGRSISSPSFLSASVLRSRTEDLLGGVADVIPWQRGDCGLLGGVLLDLSQWRTANAAVARAMVPAPPTCHRPEIAGRYSSLHGERTEAAMKHHFIRPVPFTGHCLILYVIRNPKESQYNCHLPSAEAIERFKVAFITRMDYSSTRLTAVVLE